MTDYLTEQEQIQQIKTWLKQYGLTVIVGIALAFAITSSWRYWQNYKNTVLIRASSVYDEMISLRAQGNVDGTNAQAQKLLRNFSKTPYAAMAAFMLARDAVLKNNSSEAIHQLNWVMDHAKDKRILQTARLRIARILISNKNFTESLALLKKVDDDNFLGLIDEVRGDAYLGLNNIAEAKLAYQHALNELPNAEVTRPLLQMKLDNIN